MLKLTVAVLAMAVAGSAAAAGWRSLRIDASSEASFTESVATFQEKLSPSRRMAFLWSLEDVWIEGTRRAQAEQREYTTADYRRELDGLKYEEVVRLIDPTGMTAKRYRARYYYAQAGGGPAGAMTALPAAPWPTRPPPTVNEQTCRGCTRSVDRSY